MTKTIIHTIKHTTGTLVVEHVSGNLEHVTRFGADGDLVTETVTTPDVYNVRADNGAPFGQSLYCQRATADEAIKAAEDQAVSIDAVWARIEGSR